MKVGLRLLGVVAVLMAALAVERGFLASYETAPVDLDSLRRTRAQQAVAKVVSVQPAIEEPQRDRFLPFNPVRGRPPIRLHPCAAQVLTGENRGRVVVFVNRIEGRPHVDFFLRPGNWVLLYVTTQDGRVETADRHPLPMRWRPLLWSAAVLVAVIMAVLGARGARAVLLTLGCGASAFLLTAPLIAKGLPPIAVVPLSFLSVAGLMVLLWGKGWRPAVCATGGALAGLLVGGLVAFAGSRLMELTGEASALIRLLRGREALRTLDFGQLIAAGMAIVAMGAAMDIAISVVGSLVELRRANPETSPSQLLSAGLQVNGDVAGTMVLTLVMAWLALRMPVLLVMHSYKDAFGPLWMQCYGAEVLQVVSALIAVMLAGPISAVIFSRVFAKPGTLPDVPSGSAARRPHRFEHVGVPALLVGVILVSCIGLWRSRLPETRPSLDIAAVASQSSVAPLRSWAEEWRLRPPQQQGLDESMVLLWRARELDPDDPFVQRDLAYAYMARRWTVLADEALDHVLPSLDEDGCAHYIAGVVAMWQGDGDAARAELQRALELDPDLQAARDALAALEP